MAMPSLRPNAMPCATFAMFSGIVPARPTNGPCLLTISLALSRSVFMLHPFRLNPLPARDRRSPARCRALWRWQWPRGPAPSFDAPAPRLSKPDGLCSPRQRSGRSSTSRRSVRHRCSWRALHQIQYPDRSTAALIFIEDFSREASSLRGNGLFCVLRRVAGARRGSAAYPPIAAVPGRRRQSWANNGLLRCTPALLKSAGQSPRRILECRSTEGSRRLADAPEQGQRCLLNAADILAPSMITEHHAEWRVEDMVEGALVQPSSNRLLLVGTLCLIPRCDLRLRLAHWSPNRSAGCRRRERAGRLGRRNRCQHWS